jgi:hypothetical protein
VKISVTRHAVIRAQERFPELFPREDERHTKDVLLAIGYRGKPTGESYVKGLTFRQGRVGYQKVVVIVKEVESWNDEPHSIIVTCMTPEELQNNGNNRGRTSDYQESVLQKV